MAVAPIRSTVYAGNRPWPIVSNHAASSIVFRESASLNWPAWAFLFVVAYGTLEYIGRRLPNWFPTDFAATPMTIVCSAGLICLNSQPRPVMIPWSSVTEVGYFGHSDPQQSHLDVTYRNAKGGYSTIIVQDDGKRRLAALFDSINTPKA